MDDFIEDFYKPLFEETPMVRANFMFKMLDFDEDGIIHASDLVRANEYIDEVSEFGEELSLLSNHYIQAYLKNRGILSFTDKITLYRYKNILIKGQEDARKALLGSNAPPDADESSELKKSRKKLSESDTFLKFCSCGIEELKNKMMSEPQKYKEDSVFIANRF